jgi:hypothetical protein
LQRSLRAPLASLLSESKHFPAAEVCACHVREVLYAEQFQGRLISLKFHGSPIGGRIYRAILSLAILPIRADIACLVRAETHFRSFFMREDRVKCRASSRIRFLIMCFETTNEKGADVASTAPTILSSPHT